MRRALLLVAVLALAVLAGCSGTVSEAQLAENATTNWSSDAAGSATVDEGEYRVVYRIENRSTVEFSQTDHLGQDRPLPISAVRFRAPNGTVYNHTAFDVTETNTAVELSLPARTGQLAVSAPVEGKRVVVPAVVEGAYRVVLPPETTVGLPVFSRVTPGNYSVEHRGNRTAVAWGNVTRDRVRVKFYHERDPLLAGALGGTAFLVAAAVGSYYALAIRRLRRKRAEAGLEFDRD